MNSNRSILELFASIALVGAVITAPLAMGTVHTSWVIVVLTWVLLASALGSIHAYRQNASARFTPLTALFGLLSIWSAFQIMPLPNGLLALISPTNSEVFNSSWELAYGDTFSGWRSISMDPRQTADRGLRFLALALAAFATANSGRRDRIWRSTFAAFVAVALTSLVVGIVHVSIGLETYFGFYKAVIKPGYSTFVSSNHGAALIGGAALIAFATGFRAVRSGSSRMAAVSILVGFVLVVAMIEFDSAGVVLLFGIAVGVFGAVLTHQMRRAMMAAAVLIGGGAGLIALIDVQQTRLGFWLLGSAGARNELARAALNASLDYWAVGSGAGSVDRVLVPYIDWSIVGASRVPTIENEWVEYVLTMGWPVTIAVLALIVTTFAAFRPSTEESERRLFFRATGLALTLYLIGLGGLHFPFFALGVSLPLIVVIEACSRQVNHGKPVRWPLVETHRWFGPPIALLLGFVLVLAHTHYDAPEDTADGASTADIKRWMRWIPGESQLFVALAKDALERDDTDRARALIVRGRALEPTPRFALYQAYLTTRSGEVDNALALYQKLATTPMAARAGQDAARYLDNYEGLAASFQEADPAVWNRISSELTRRHGPEAAVAFATKLAELRPNASEPFALVVKAHWTAKRFDVAELWARYLVLRRLKNTEGLGPQGYGLWIESLRRQGKVQHARTLAMRAFDLVPGDPNVQRAVMQMRPTKASDVDQEELGKISRAHELGCRPPIPDAKRRSCLLAESWLAEARGDHDAAIRPLKIMQRRYKDPRPLAQYYRRKSKCIAIRSLLSSLKKDDPYRVAVKNLVDQCGRVAD